MNLSHFERKRDYIIPGRIDLQVEILPVPFDKLSGMSDGEPSAAIRERVVKAREIQAIRYRGENGIFCNAQMNSRLMKQYCALDDECQQILKHAMTKYDMSARAYDRILKVARTHCRPRRKRRDSRRPHPRGHLLPQPRPFLLGRNPQLIHLTTNLLRALKRFVAG